MSRVAPHGKRDLKAGAARTSGNGNSHLTGSACGNESRAAERAIFNIVGPITLDVGWISRANNVEGGNSREARSESRVLSNIRKQTTSTPDP